LKDVKCHKEFRTEIHGTSSSRKVESDIDAAYIFKLSKIQQVTNLVLFNTICC